MDHETRLLERFDLAGKDVLHVELPTGQVLECVRDESQGEQGTLRPTAHGPDPQLASLEVLNDGVQFP